MLGARPRTFFKWPYWLTGRVRVCAALICAHVRSSDRTRQMVTWGQARDVKKTSVQFGDVPAPIRVTDDEFAALAARSLWPAVPTWRKNWANPTRSRRWGRRSLIKSRNPWDHLQMTFPFVWINGKRTNRFPSLRVEWWFGDTRYTAWPDLAAI